MVNAKKRQDSRVEVMDVNRIGDDVVAEIVGLAVGQPGLGPPACGPDGEAAGMVIAAVVVGVSLPWL